MKTTIILLGFFCSGPAQLFAPTGSPDSSAVSRAAMEYIEGFYEGDTAKLSRSILPSVTKYGYFFSKRNNVYEGETMSFSEMITYALKVKSKNAQPKPGWPKKVKLLDMQDQTACVKVTAWWGTDYLTLAKTGNRWMIHHVLWQGPLKV